MVRSVRSGAICGWAKSVVFLLAAMSAAGCEELARSTRRAEAPGPVSPAALAKVGLHYYWKFPLRLSAGERIEQVYRLDENFYCVTSHRRLIATDAQRGLFKWAYTIGHETETIFRPVHADRMLLRDQQDGIQDIMRPREMPPATPFDGVMVNTLSALVVLDRKTGRRVRVVKLNFAANTSGATDGVNFYAASTRGHYYAIRLGPEVQTWTMSTDDVITAPVVYYDKNVYVASQDKTMCAVVGQEHRKMLWRRDFPGPILAQFHVDGRGCFVGTLNGRIYALDRTTGQQVQIPDPVTKGWMDWGPFICNGRITDPIQVGLDTVFQRVRGDKFYAINVDTGKLRWAHPHGRLALAVIEHTVYLLDKDRTLLLVEEVAGKVRTSLPMTGWDLFVPNARLSAVYAATRGGMLCCIRPKGSKPLTPVMLNPKLMPKAKKKAGGK